MARNGSRKRWECPTGKHPAVLGPMRPRKDDIVRYCLPCSQKSGRLTERIAPALQKARAVGKERSIAKAQRKREVEKRHEQAYFTVAGIDANEYARKLATLPAFSKVQARKFMLVLHRVSNNHRKMGHADYCGAPAGRIDLFIKDGWGERTLRDTLIHELAHLQVWFSGKRGVRPHGKHFQRVYERAHEQADVRFPSGYAKSWDTAPVPPHVTLTVTKR